MANFKVPQETQNLMCLGRLYYTHQQPLNEHATSHHKNMNC